MTQMTVAEIVDETVAFYNEDVSRRAIVSYPHNDGITCLYTDQHGRHCAIGRCLIDENFNTTGSVEHIWDSGLPNMPTLLDDDLKEQYCGHTIQFWSDLQELHDSSQSWNKHGITEFGRELADEIKHDHA